MKTIDLIEKNKDFIAEECIEFLARNYVAYNFDPEIMRRDIIMILDIVGCELRIDGVIGTFINVKPGTVEDYWDLNKYKASFRELRKKNAITFEVIKETEQLLTKVLKNEIVELPRCDKFKQFIEPRLIVPEEQLKRIPEIFSLIAANCSIGIPRSEYLDFIEDYFEKGFVVTQTPTEIHKRLWDEVNNTNWVSSEGNTYKKIPDWYVQKKRRYTDPTGSDRQFTERWEGLYGYYHAPESLKKIAEDLIHHKIFEPLRLWRPPKAIPKFIHFWNGSENSPHHVDSIDGSDVMIFCYATDAGEWQKDWGGYINLLKEVNGEFYYCRNVMPDDQRMVVVNNSAPIFKHGIRNLVNTEVNRYTFIFHYTWEYDSDKNYGIDN